MIGMPRYDLMISNGTLKEWRPYKPPRRPLVEHIGITGVQLSMIITFAVTVTATLILFIRWWMV